MAAPSTSPSRADDVFYCPSCGQKHRGDLSTIKLGGALRAKCAGCGVPLTVEWREERAVARLRDALPAKAKDKPVEKDVPRNENTTAEVPDALAKAAPAVPARDKPAAPEVRAAPRTKRDRERAKEKEEDPERDLEPIVAEFAPGSKVDRYTIEEAIGQGGTGTVYRAFDPTTNRLVALKFLGAGQSDAMRQRFLREIEVQANLRHPNLMPVFDRGEHEGRPFFTMELLYKPFTLTQIVTMARSGTIGKYATLKRFGELETLIREVFLPVCDGIHIANVENGVVHRDLKPDNILLDSRTLRPYVIDYGICHVLEKKSRTGGIALEPTAEDAGIVGTPRFLAPEQARGTVHERTDVWGLGAILYYCVTGDAPIAASTPITRAELGRRIEALKAAEKTARADGDETRAELCSDKLSRLEDAGLRTLDDLYRDAREGVYVPLPSGLPAAASAIVRKAMSAKTVERYVNARSLGADVESWLARGQTRAMAEQGSSAASVVQGVQRGLRRSVATAAVAVAVGVGAFLWGRSASAPKAAGGDVGTTVSGVLSDLDGFDRRLEAAKPRVARLSPADAALLYDLLADDLSDERRTTETLPPGADRDAARARVAFVADRIAPARIKLEMPGAAAAATLDDVVRRTTRDLTTGETAVAPGEYRVTIGSGVRIPLVMPFVIREGSKAADREPPKVKLVLPIAADAVPDGLALVVPGADTVDPRGPPYGSAATVPARVAPFLMDKREVSNGEWLAFLEALPNEADRKAHAPALDFVADAEHPGHWMLAGDVTRAKQLPVRGITPDDAIAFCAWRSKRDGAVVRLPTEAEWVVAAGGLLGYDLPGGLKGTADDGDLAAPVAVTAIKDKDVSPYGVYGMLGNVREIVTSIRASEGASDQFLSKGAGAGDEPSEAAIRKIRPMARDVRDPRTGLRCVREIK